MDIAFLLLAFTSFFTLMNPLGVMPVYLTMTRGLAPEQRRATVQKAVVTATVALLAFSFSGQFLFKFFGISVDSLKIAGGFILFFIGQDMLQARLVKTEIHEEDVREYVSDVSITPLAIPMICGPRAITNAIVLMNEAHTPERIGILTVTIVVMGFITWLVLRQSERIAGFLGDTGNKVLMRLMGLIVMVIAVEFFIAGARPVVRSMLAA